MDWLELVDLVALAGAVWWVARWTQRIEREQKRVRKRVEALEALEQERTSDDPPS